MSIFTFQIDDEEDGTTTIVQFNSETWLDAFPKFLDVCRGAGFSIPDGVALYSPSASEYMFGDRDFLLFEDDLVKFVVNDKDNTEHSESYDDSTRNR